MDSKVRRYAIVRKLNSFYYHYRTNRWRWSPRFRSDDPAIPIDRPVFLLGTQGGGLTLLARILRRSESVVSVSGNARYWAGADEMQTVLWDVLPEKLTWRNITVPGFESKWHNWVYASKEFFEHYHEDESGATPELEKEFKSILRRVIRLNRLGSDGVAPRFLDKSQSNTVRVGLVHKLLEDCHPKFVLLLRNPFAMVWRAASGDSIVSKLNKSLPEKLEISVQHWKNSMQAALEKKDAVDMAVWRFEDVLAEPERRVREICRFTEIPFDTSILPGPEDRIPWGSMYDAFNRRKWYPLRPGVNDRYLREIPDWAIEVVQRECGALAGRFGYEPPTREAVVSGSRSGLT